jgi:hypothetical protein
MRRAWKWINYVSNALGWAFLLAEGCAWIGWSFRAGRVLGYPEFRRLLDETLFQLADWLGSHTG